MPGRLLRHARKDHSALAKNAAHTLAARHALCVYSSGTVYTFIPKNGCTTLRLSLALENGCIADAERDIHWIHDNNGAFCADLRDLVTASFTFVVFRCPHARLASAFLDKIVGKTIEFWSFEKAHRGKIVPDEFTFREFVGLLKTPKNLRLNIHWRPQVDFLVYEEYDLWVPLERFAEFLPAIETGAGLAVIDARTLSGHGTDRLEPLDGSFADTPLHELAALRRAGKVPSHTALYDAALAASVAALYAGDRAIYREKFGADDMLFADIPDETGAR